jgi:PTS system nitrogen regulatory IIA component
MEIADIINPHQVIAALRVGDKASLIKELARRAAAELGLEPQAIIGALEGREQMGSTGMGSGIALPHARIEKLNRFFGLFARLERPIDFAAIDGKPVDLVVLLLIPPGAGSEHLSALACIARRLRDGAAAKQLRTAETASDLYSVLTGSPGR